MRWLIPAMTALVGACGTVEPPVPAEGQGVVRLECAVLEDGRLADCKVLSERPAGQGFGEAALRAAGQARLEPDALRPPGAKIQYSIRFRLDDPAALDLPPPRA